MKRIVFILCLSLMSNSLILAQDIETEEPNLGLQTDTVSQEVPATTEREITISESYYRELIGYRDSLKEWKDKYQELDNDYDSLRGQYEALSDSLRLLSNSLDSLNDSLWLYKKGYAEEQAQNESLRAKLIKGDKQLISMASNFLYIPYEAFSVERIAIPAYESVQDEALREQYRVRYDLLKNYKADISGMAALLRSIHDKCSAHFASNGQSEEWIKQITQSSIAVRYQQYDDWQNTYIGQVLTEVVRYLKVFDKATTPQKIEAKIQELDRCIETGNSL